MNYYHNDFEKFKEDNPNYSGSWNEDGTYRYTYTSPQKEEPKKKKKGSGLLKLVCFALIFGILAGGSGYGVFRASEAIFGKAVPESSTISSGTSVSGTAVSSAVAVSDVSDIAANVLPAVVQVTNMSIVEYRGFFGQIYSQPAESAGSGVVISEDNDHIYIASNNHVVSDARTITITFIDGSAVEAEVQGTYPDKDLAVIKVKKDNLEKDTLDSIKIANLADGDELKVGQAVVAIGNALGYGTSVTAGILSALNREVSLQDESTGVVYTNELLQTDAAINPGNSGGALLNMKGQVIGIVSAKYSDTKVEGMGYAIPISDAKEIIDEIINNGAYQAKPAENEDGTIASNGAYLGIYGGMDIDQETSNRYNMPMGVYVSRVVEGSGAEKAGIKSGDVIRAVDGKLALSMEALQQIIGSYHPGDSVKVTVATAQSNYKDSEFVVTLTEKIEENVNENQ